MKEEFVMFAKYLQDKNEKFGVLLDKLSNAEREKDRGSYYKSASGLFRHIIGTPAFFAGMIQGALADGAPAKTVAFPNFEYLEGEITEAQWKQVREVTAKIDAAFLDLVSKLRNEDLQTKAKWFSGDMVPIYFVLHSLIAHQIHHQGALSQILDELKIDNDLSGINVGFMG
ncbi:MAG: DinB family protein [Spirochaetaceae bacterium]|jgi:uncharacterized damage-inducible protein DinB|nr:DinB family protein [Spirochaetaceae bacterium]